MYCSSFRTSGSRDASNSVTSVLEACENVQLMLHRKTTATSQATAWCQYILLLFVSAFRLCSVHVAIVCACVLVAAFYSCCPCSGLLAAQSGYVLRPQHMTLC